MNLQNFNINNILKNSDSNQRAMILFDTIIKEVFIGERTLTDSEKEVLVESFKTNNEIRIYNKYYQFFNQTMIAGLEIEKDESKIEHLKYILISLIQDYQDINKIADKVADILNKALVDGFIAKNKRQEFITMMSSLITDIENNTKYYSLKKFCKSEDNEEAEDELEVFHNITRIIKNKMQLRLYSMNFCQGLLKDKYKELDVKLSSIDKMIIRFDEDIKKTQDFVDGCCSIIPD